MSKKKVALFKFKPFSKKQKQVLNWWMESSPVSDKDILIADGSVRAGKTVVMSLSFVMWAMEVFDGENLALCGKTIGSLRRNVVKPLKRMLKGRGYKCKEHRADNYITISRNGVSNDFYLFGGKDEGSQDLIQGITLAGVLFDEVALMPQSFVNQATARCSIDGAKMWFNCNPDGPYHWFKVEYLDKLEEKNAVHLHFTMDDNLSLSEKVKERYKRMYSGIFYKRYILGLWCLAEGVIYDMFNEDFHKVKTVPRKYEKYYVSVDYGTQNATVFLLWGLCEGKWYIVKEYYYSGRDKSLQRTDVQYSKDLKKFLGGIVPVKIIIDPSAASFIAQLKGDGFTQIRKAKNDVLDGIRTVASALSLDIVKVNDCCKETMKEFTSYVWDPKKASIGMEEPLKDKDHCMDAMRYFIYTILKRNIEVKYDKEIYNKGMGLKKNVPLPYKKGGTIF
ncbi:PBSX family phage terminase large subunit [Hathewaya histolytica]|uniref:Phage terminase large subunit n=1 Tax=Hathewaya histolytica TaxID=1498 RepID=A0A4U9RCF5_HATHI|nr:PBSX family phage terminase large subunit [Hathewaya histolytica]VTQ88658.1 phage terminase large subunit [Hathewaya histolytica]